MIKPSERGFTMIEMLIVLALVAVAMAIVVPSMSSLTGANLRSASREVNGAINESFSAASLSGKIHRLAVDLDKAQFRIEIQSSAAPSKETTNTRKFDEKHEGQDEIADQVRQVVGDRVFEPISDDLGTWTKLTSGIDFISFWMEPMRQKMTKGIGYLYFYPDGYTHLALIALGEKRSSGNTLTLRVQSLTGEVSVEEGDSDIPTGSK